MTVRRPIVSGQFYPSGRGACLDQIRQCIPEDVSTGELPSALFGGIVPHAGWTFSGPTAARVFAAIAARKTPKTVVLFGADHARASRAAAVYPGGAWSSPLGDVEVDEPLAERVGASSPIVVEDALAHGREHSIEVQIPFVQHFWPEAKILPIIVAPGKDAPEVGRVVAQALADGEAVLLGSTDLTHYGPNYGFTPQGIGQEALDWAKNVNDKKLIDTILERKAEEIVPEAAASRSACGAGAIAATVAGCNQLGANQAVLLEHTTSYEVARRFMDESATMAVGYAGIVFGST